MRLCPNCLAIFAESTAICPTDATPTVHSEPPGQVHPPGSKLGPFDLEEAIGSGSMGVVHRARHSLLGRRFAVKVVAADLCRDAEALDRFIREARAASSVRHRGIVEVSDLGVAEDGSLYYAMELLDGRSLRQEIERRSPMTDARVVRILDGMLDALGAVHAAGIVHRDLKPDNVWLGGEGDDEVAKLMDFGVARLQADTRSAPGTLLGTAAYVAPEQLAARPVDARADLYAIGVIAFEMSTGRRPFDGDTEALLAARRAPAPSPRQIVSSVGEALDAVVRRALAPAPEDRFASAAEMRAALRGAAVLASPSGTRPPRRAGRPVLIALAGVLAVLAVVIGATAGPAPERARVRSPAVRAAPDPPVVTPSAEPIAPAEGASQPEDDPGASGKPDAGPAAARPRSPRRPRLFRDP